MWLRALFLMAVILILEGHVAGGYVRPATSMTRLATQPSVSLDRTDASRFRLNWNPFRQNFNKLFPATTTTTSTTRPAIQPSVSLHRTDASGFHFNWNFQEVFGSTIKKIELFAVPVNSELGVANVSTVVFSNATSGSITTGLRPYTEYETAVVVTTNETTTTHPVKRAWTWGTGM
uniref:Fibronectin type-III domain-containing protein n=1 Tax=Mesocestoides corti TaxID=53468 RepID=A0A5K3F7R7_MESCO